MRPQAARTEIPLIRRAAAACLGLALCLFAGLSLAGGVLTGSDISTTFLGLTLDGVYADGITFTETFRPDGADAYSDGRGVNAGHWWVSGDTICTFYDALTGGCFAVERDGSNCFTFYVVDDGARRASAWTARGWDHDRPATCPGGEVAAR